MTKATRRNRSFPLPQKNRSMDPREHEVLIMGCLLHNAEARANLYNSYWNNRYYYMLHTPNQIAHTLKSDKRMLALYHSTESAPPITQQKRQRCRQRQMLVWTLFF